MTAAGGLDGIAEENATPAERAALDMIVFSPRRVTLPPHQPQVVRVGVRVPARLPPGEYRAHMLFRAVPGVVPAVAGQAKLALTGVAVGPNGSGAGTGDASGGVAGVGRSIT